MKLLAFGTKLTLLGDPDAQPTSASSEELRPVIQREKILSFKVLPVLGVWGCVAEKKTKPVWVLQYEDLAAWLISLAGEQFSRIISQKSGSEKHQLLTSSVFILSGRNPYSCLHYSSRNQFRASSVPHLPPYALASLYCTLSPLVRAALQLQPLIFEGYKLIALGKKMYCLNK